MAVLNGYTLRIDAVLNTDDGFRLELFLVVDGLVVPFCVGGAKSSEKPLVWRSPHCLPLLPESFL